MNTRYSQFMVPSSFIIGVIFVFLSHLFGCGHFRCHLRFSLPPFWLRSFFVDIFVLRCHLHFSMPSSFFVIIFVRYHPFVAIIFRSHLHFSMSSSFFDALFVFRVHIFFSLPPFCCYHFSLTSSFFDVIFVFRCHLRFSFSYFCATTFFVAIIFR